MFFTKNKERKRKVHSTSNNGIHKATEKYDHILMALRYSTTIP